MARLTLKSQRRVTVMYLKLRKQAEKSLEFYSLNDKEKEQVKAQFLKQEAARLICQM